MYLYLFMSTAWKFFCTVCSTVYLSMYNIGPLGWGHFWPQNNNLNKLGKLPLGYATYIPNVNALSLVFFIRFLYIFKPDLKI